MHALKLGLLAPLLLLQIACANATDWWQTPPADTDNAIYGLGEGQTLALAQQQALADISGKLSTRISASLQRITQDTGVAYDDTVRRQISSATNNTELSHFQLIKTTQQASRVFALVELDRNKLADMWRMQLSSQRNKLQPLVERNNIANFSQWLEVSQALNEAASSRNLSLQLYALDGTPPAADLHHQLMQLLQTQPLTIAVQGSQPKLTQALQQQLNLPGLTLCRANCQLRLHYDYQTEHDTMFGEFVSDTTVLIKLEQHNMLLASQELSAQVTSVASYKSADAGSLNSIIDQLQQRGLWQLLQLPL